MSTKRELRAGDWGGGCLRGTNTDARRQGRARHLFTTLDIEHNTLIMSQGRRGRYDSREYSPARSRSRDKDRSRSRSPDTSISLPGDAKPISDSDYFLKSDEFRVWLKDEKHKVGHFLLPYRLGAHITGSYPPFGFDNPPSIVLGRTLK